MKKTLIAVTALLWASAVSAQWIGHISNSEGGCTTLLASHADAYTDPDSGEVFIGFRPPGSNQSLGYEGRTLGFKPDPSYTCAVTAPGATCIGALELLSPDTGYWQAWELVLCEKADSLVAIELEFNTPSGAWTRIVFYKIP